ncbi:MAG TPA: ABC transporter permease subunit [Actinospica sp.]|nr:ABC transporter permease subunit [Actinospica sp.]
MARRTPRLRGLAMASPPVLVAAAFIGMPVVSAILFSFGYFGGFNSILAEIGQHEHLTTGASGTLDAYRDVFGESEFRQSVWATLLVTTASTAVVLALSWGIALYLRLSGGRIGTLLAGLAVVPMFIPVVIASYAILEFYSPTGFLRSLAAAVGWSNAPVYGYTMVGVALGQIWVNLPFGVLLMTSGLNAVPDALIEAARDAGATTTRIVRSVLLPMAAVPTTIVATFTAIGVIGSYTVPYLIGPSAPNMLGPLMTYTFESFNQPQQAEVMAVAVFLVSAVIGAFYVRANLRGAKESKR